MSKWKYVRKKDLSRFQGYEQATGIMLGLFVASMLNVVAGYGSVVPSLLIFGVYVVYWHVHRDKFARIRKAIDDAGGDLE